jgi:hypothetical protein
MRPVLSLLLPLLSLVGAQLSLDNLETHVNACTLSASLNPIEEAYWTGYPHHRRTPFALSPDGSTAYLAYLDASGTDVHVQPINPETFAATGTPVTVSGAKEAAGLVAHDDGFALLANEAMPSGTSGAPPDSTPVAVLYRYTNGEQTFKTWLGGPDIDSSDSLASPDVNGDLVFSSEAGYYAAYIVVTSYSGSASGHFGDAIRYVTTDGTLETIQGASSSWGCSHNTGIAFEAADEPPFASICAEDQGAIWLNTLTQGMGNNGVKISNEHVVNGGSNEAMGGMSGSYSGLARFQGASSYIFSWVSRGAIDLAQNEWMGSGYTSSDNRTSNRNVAIALFSDKQTIVGDEAISEVGAADGDTQVNWITDGSADCSNAHVATFDGTQALVTWEEIASPICDFDAMGCRGDFSGSYYQLVDGSGAKVGEPVQSLDTYVAGDMVTMSDGRICWPYVNMEWRLDTVALSLPDATTTNVSFACMNLAGAVGGGSSGGDGGSSASSSPSQTATPSQTTSPEPTSQADNSVSDTTQSATTEASEHPISTPNAPAPSASAEEEQSTPVVSEGLSAVTTVTSAAAAAATSATRSCYNHTAWETVTVFAGR